MLNRADFDRLLLMITHADFKSFVHPALVCVHTVVGALALAGHVKRIAGVHANGSVFGGVVNYILADEFQVAIGIAAVEAQLTFRQRNSQMIVFGVLELFHDPDFWIGSGAVVYVLADLIGIVI